MYVSVDMVDLNIKQSKCFWVAWNHMKLKRNNVILILIKKTLYKIRNLLVVDTVCIKYCIVLAQWKITLNLDQVSQVKNVNTSYFLLQFKIDLVYFAVRERERVLYRGEDLKETIFVCVCVEIICLHLIKHFSYLHSS